MSDYEDYEDYGMEFENDDDTFSIGVGVSKSKVKRILKIIGVAALSVLATVTVLRFTVGFADTKTIGSMAYSVGAINDAGKIEQDEGSIYTRDFVKAEGMQVDVNKKADVSYKVFFFDKDNNFLSCTNELTTDFVKTGVPEGAVYAKVMVTPLDDDDGKVGIFEVGNYANQIKVTVKK